jgi:hypothetical protein
MASRGVLIADDVVTVINGGSFTIPDAVVAQRLYITDHELTDLKSLKVSVMLSENPQGINARNSTQSDYMISVGVQKKTDNITTDFDALVELVEEINALFRFSSLSGTGVSWVASEIDPIYDPDHATRLGVFTSVLMLTFRDFLKK